MKARKYPQQATEERDIPEAPPEEISPSDQAPTDTHYFAKKSRDTRHPKYDSWYLLIVVTAALAVLVYLFV